MTRVRQLSICVREQPVRESCSLTIRAGEQRKANRARQRSPWKLSNEQIAGVEDPQGKLA